MAKCETKPKNFSDFRKELSKVTSSADPFKLANEDKDFKEKNLDHVVHNLTQVALDKAKANSNKSIAGHFKSDDPKKDITQESIYQKKEKVQAVVLDVLKSYFKSVDPLYANVVDKFSTTEEKYDFLAQRFDESIGYNSNKEHNKVENPSIRRIVSSLINGKKKKVKDLKEDLRILFGNPDHAQTALNLLSGQRLSRALSGIDPAQLAMGLEDKLGSYNVELKDAFQLYSSNDPIVYITLARQLSEGRYDGLKNYGLEVKKPAKK